MKISLIASIDQNNGIGKEGDLLCYISTDLKRFKQLTTGHTILMGRKTFESLPKGALPNRTNVVLSHNTEQHFDNCVVLHSMNEALEYCKTQNEVFVIGGGQLYELFLPLANKLYITHVHHSFEADTFFPPIDPKKWELTQEQHLTAEKADSYDFSFLDYQRQ